MRVPKKHLGIFKLTDKQKEAFSNAIEKRTTVTYYEYDFRNLSLMHKETILYTLTIPKEVRDEIGDFDKLCELFNTKGK